MTLNLLVSTTPASPGSSLTGLGSAGAYPHMAVDVVSGIAQPIGQEPAWQRGLEGLMRWPAGAVRARRSEMSMIAEGSRLDHGEFPLRGGKTVSWHESSPLCESSPSWARELSAEGTVSLRTAGTLRRGHRISASRNSPPRTGS